MNLLFLIISISSAQNITEIIQEKRIINPVEYYLIILGILTGALIFLFVIFSVYYFNRKRRPVIVEHPQNDFYYHHNTIFNPLHENVNQRFNPFQESYKIEIQEDFHQDSKSCDEEFSGFENLEKEYLEVSNLKRRVSTSSLRQNNSKKYPVLKKTYSEKIEIKDREIENKNNLSENKENFLEDKDNFSKDKEIFSEDKENFSEDKNNLLDELKKKLPNLIPKNMI